MPSAAQEVAESAETIESFALLTESLAEVTKTAAELTAQMTENAGKNQALLAEAADRVTDSARQLQDVSAEIGKTLDTVTAYYDSTAKKLLLQLLRNGELRFLTSILITGM